MKHKLELQELAAWEDTANTFPKYETFEKMTNAVSKTKIKSNASSVFKKASYSAC